MVDRKWTMFYSYWGKQWKRILEIQKIDKGKNLCCFGVLGGNGVGHEVFEVL